METQGHRLGYGRPLPSKRRETSILSATVGLLASSRAAAAVTRMTLASACAISCSDAANNPSIENGWLRCG